MPPALIDITGQRFHRLTVLRRNGRLFNGQVHAWLCRCDCGNVVTRAGNSLRYGASRSCGCLKVEAAKQIGGRKRIGDDDAAFRQVLNYYTQGAKRRQLAWELSQAEFRRLVTAICHYCGAAPNKRRPRSVEFIFGGIDRLDSSKGYEPINCVPCCSQCNYAKSDMTAADFIRWLRAIQRHWNETELAEEYQNG